MNSVGIIAEYNPFHNGHLYHLSKVKEMFPNHIIVLILSGNYLQRGEFSILDKYTKTKIVLENGIDLIIELPFNFAVQSADMFAKGAIQLLNELKVEHLVFGSETNNIEDLKLLSKIQLENSNYQIKVKELMKKGINYPTALSKALKEISNMEVTTPNDILGLSYVREIIKNNYNINPICIKRTNDYHDLENNSNIVSASNIRNKINNNIDIKKYVPLKTYEYLKEVNINFNYSFKYLKFKIISEINKLDEYLDVDEGIDNRIKKYIYSSNNYQELIDNIKTKRYTYNKISRMLCHILTGFKKSDVVSNIEYIRILGMNNIGKNYINSIKKNITLPIITKFSDFNDKYQQLELKLSYIYSLILEDNMYVENEIKAKVIIQNKND